MIEGFSLIRPGLSEAMGLLDKWVVCRVVPFEGGSEGWTIEPAQVVGVVVPSSGGAVKAQLLLSSTPWDERLEGFEYEVFLCDVVWLRCVPPRSRDASLVSVGPDLGAELA